MLTDPISNLLTRIRNASHARRKELMVPSSKILKAIADVLSSKSFIESTEETVTDTNRKELKISLRTDQKPLELKRISKPGQRIYIGYENIKRIRSGLGVAIISTSKGVMSGDEAKKQKLGGEYICEVY